MDMDPEQLRMYARDVERMCRLADETASSCAVLLCGRLRLIKPEVAARLKRELRGFNSQTGKWKE